MNYLLITGANGYLGTELRKIMPENWRAICLLSETNKINSSSEDDCSKLNFFGYEDLEERCSVTPFAVLHLAAKIPYKENYDKKKLFSVNVELVQKLVDKYPYARHVLASSVSVYKTTQAESINVHSHIEPGNEYAATKLMAEDILNKTDNHAIVRFSSIVGKGMYPKTFLPLIIKAAEQGVINLYGDGTRMQNYISVADAALICVKAIKDKANLIILGVGPKSYSNRQIAEMVAANYNDVKINYVAGSQGPSFLYEQNYYSYDTEGEYMKNVIDEMIKT